MIVTLSSGIKIEVVPVPYFALERVRAANPIPLELKGDERQTALAAREQMVMDTARLMALPDVVVPDGWEVPAALTQFANVQPREGKWGRKVDYIEYELIVSGDDLEKLSAGMWGHVTEDEIGSAEATFQRDGGRETDTEDSIE